MTMSAYYEPLREKEVKTLEGEMWAFAPSCTPERDFSPLYSSKFYLSNMNSLMLQDCLLLGQCQSLPRVDDTILRKVTFFKEY